MIMIVDATGVGVIIEIPRQRSRAIAQLWSYIVAKAQALDLTARFSTDRPGSTECACAPRFASSAYRVPRKFEPTASDARAHGERAESDGSPIDFLAALVLVEGGSRMVVGLTGHGHVVRLL